MELTTSNLVTILVVITYPLTALLLPSLPYIRSAIVLCFVLYILLVHVPAQVSPEQLYSNDLVLISVIPFMFAAQTLYFASLSAADAKALSIKTYLLGYISMMFPVETVEPRPQSWVACLLQSVKLIIIGASKLFFGLYLYYWAADCMKGNYSWPTPYSSWNQYSFIFFVMAFTSGFQFDFQSAILILVTKGKYQMVPLSRNFFMSSSIREFWGKRYNPRISVWLKNIVFNPMRTRLGVSPQIAGLGAFSVSGLMHVYQMHLTVDNGLLPTFLFFFLSGCACALESTPFFRKNIAGTYIGMLWTQLFLYATCPLYLGYFFGKGALFFEKNPPPSSMSSFGEVIGNYLPPLCPADHSFSSINQ